VGAKIHVPDPELGEALADEEPAATNEEPGQDGAEAPKPKKKTRRGTRGGRGRKKKTAAARASSDGDSDRASEEETKTDWEYVPMSEWDDEELS
jgi:hypothetical protein